jgi:hypothetical protein
MILKNNLKYQHVTDFDGFRRLFAVVVANNRRYRWLSSAGSLAAFLWPALILFLIVAVLTRGGGEAGVVVIVCLMLLGMFALQVIFVVSHLEAHALFFDYSDHVPGTRLEERTPVYFAAFLHHHQRTSAPWFPDLAISNTFGYNNVGIAHWVSFSVTFGDRCWLPALLALVDLKVMWFFIGYEVGVWLLPYAHGFQHSSVESMGALPLTLMTMLNKLGLVASPSAHGNHHSIAHRTVYQDFSSSGFHMKQFDTCLNRRWDQYYDHAVTTNGNLYDIVHKDVFCVYIAILVVVPTIIAITGHVVTNHT